MSSRAGPRLTTTLSERASKELLAAFGVPLAPERTATDPDTAVAAASALGFPVVAQVERRRHRPQVRTTASFASSVPDASAVRDAARALLGAARSEDGDVELLVAPMISGMRELIAGAVRDPQFGPTVMLGVGGILAEAVDDVVFRPAPLDRATAIEMIDDLRTAAMLGPFRGESAVDREAVASTLVAVGRLIAEREDIASVDVNPLKIGTDGAPVAVDALIELRAAPTWIPIGPAPGAADSRAVRVPCSSPVEWSSPGRRRTLASSGSCRCTTCWHRGTPGRSTAPTSTARSCLECRPSGTCPRSPTEEPTSSSCAPHPPPTRHCSTACAAKGIKAAFLTSAGYAESGPAGKLAEQELVDLAGRARHPARRPQRPGRGQHTDIVVRPDRRSLPSARTHRRRQPERQLRFELPQSRQGHWRRHLAGSFGRQRRRRVRRRLPVVLRRRSGDERQPGLRRGDLRRARPVRPAGGRCPAQAPRAPQGRRDHRRGPCRGEPHRGVGEPTTRSSTASAAPPGSSGRQRSKRRSRQQRRSPRSLRRAGRGWRW